MFTVREKGKDGGRVYRLVEAAIQAAIDWHAMTGVSCEVLDPYGRVLMTITG